MCRGRRLFFNTTVDTMKSHLDDVSMLRHGALKGVVNAGQWGSGEEVKSWSDIVQSNL